jgi:hypothetical protein
MNFYLFSHVKKNNVYDATIAFLTSKINSFVVHGQHIVRKPINHCWTGIREIQLKKNLSVEELRVAEYKQRRALISKACSKGA